MDYKLTSVKILKELYRNFKSKTIDDEFTLQKLVNRSMDLYVLDEECKSMIHKYDNLIPSGSKLWVIWEMILSELVDYNLRLG